MKNSRVLVKTLFAIVVGLPITLMLGFMATVVLFTGLVSMTEIPGVRNVPTGIVVTAWGIAGLTGLLGFWLWVFMPRAATALRRKVAAAAIVAGICAVGVLAMTGEPGLTTLAVMAITVGALIVAWLLKPEFPGNPDAPLKPDGD